jgi:hypothetical protein
MLNEVNEALLDLEKCSLPEVINILQKESNNFSINFIKQDLVHT